jgi:hypothetical protein
MDNSDTVQSIVMSITLCFGGGRGQVLVFRAVVFRWLGRIRDAILANQTCQFFYFHVALT